MQHRVDHELHRQVFRRDPGYVRDHLRAVDRVLSTYFVPEVRGVERLPDDGPFLLVANHSGGVLMPDMWALGSALVHRFGPDRPLYGLTFDFVFAIPGVSDALRKVGAIPASLSNAETALQSGAGVLVYPGGDREVYRPWTQRNRVDLQGHMGFVRLALRRGVPVFPTVSHGSHDSLVVVSRGDRLARALGLHRLRIDVFPLVLGLPFGLASVVGPYVPLPAKIIVEVLEPLDWSATHGPEAADDPDVVRSCYDDVVDRMQGALDRLIAEMPHPVRSGLLGHVGRRAA